MKASQAVDKVKKRMALDEFGAQSYLDGAYKTGRRGVAFAPALSVRNRHELLSPAQR